MKTQMEMYRSKESSKHTVVEPFVSVLTPVYNQGQYLEECIQSVINQNYSNWEYVIVNNCSTDNSLEIAEKYALKDSRIRIHNNTQYLPVMENLNHAFRQISPESIYCKVVHGDDWMFPDCIVKMVTLAEQYPSIGIVNSYFLEGGKVSNTGISYPKHVIDGRKISRDYLLGKSNYFGAPSNLLIKSSLIRKKEKFYDESYLQSDMSACLDLLRESDFGFVHQVLTFTRRHEESLTNCVAKKHFKYMLGDLKMHLEYGPLFLSKEIYDKVIKKREEVFYIQFARNMVLNRMREAYHNHSRELKSINFRVKKGKLFKYIFRELFLQFLQKSGVELRRRQNGEAVKY